MLTLVWNQKVSGIAWRFGRHGRRPKVVPAMLKPPAKTALSRCGAKSKQTR